MRRGQPGRPLIPREVRGLIRQMCRENPGRGAPRIHSELLKLGINVGESSVRKYMVRGRKPLADLAHVPGESRQAAGLHRLLRGAHLPFPTREQLAQMDRKPYPPESNSYRYPAGEQLNYVGLNVRNRAHAVQLSHGSTG